MEALPVCLTERLPYSGSAIGLSVADRLDKTAADD